MAAEAPALLHVVGYLTGASLYAMLLAMVVMSRGAAYRLTLTTGGFVDHTLPLAVQAGQPAEVALFGWNLPSAAAKVTRRVR